MADSEPDGGRGRRAASATAGCDARTVGDVAALTGVTIRALHHWDVTGLVRPSARTSRGYRLYSPVDVDRVRRVVIYRELGLSLESIRAILDTRTDDPVAPLRAQRDQLLDHVARLRGMVDAVDRMIDAAATGIGPLADEQVEIFGDGWDPARVAQAQERWGTTPEWMQYAERTATMTPDDWKRVARATAQLDDDLAEAMRAGVLPGSTRADAIAERHRASLDAYFTCTHDRHVCVARSFTDDPGYAAHYDAKEPGLGRWLRSVIEANAATRGVDPATATWD